MVSVANLVFNSFINDSRVIKETVSLTKHNYKVEVIAHLDRDLQKLESKNDFLIRRFSYLNRKVTKSLFVKLIAYAKYIKECVSYCKKFDIIHCNDLNTLPIGFIIKKFYNKNVKIVYDAHEYETEVNGLSGAKKKIIYRLEKMLIKSADKVICVSDTIANEYVKLYNIEKPALVLNTPPLKNINKDDIFRKTFCIDANKTIFLYQGGLSSGRGIEILLETFKNIKNNKSVIVFMGYGPLEKLVIEASTEYDNIYFHEAVNPDVLLGYTSSADFGISTIEDTCLSYRYCLPNKMFEYTMAGLPLIVSDLPEMKKVVENNDIGIVLKENTPSGLSKAIKKALKLNKAELQGNIEQVKKVYNWEEQEKVLLKLYGEL